MVQCCIWKKLHRHLKIIARSPYDNFLASYTFTALFVLHLNLNIDTMQYFSHSPPHIASNIQKCRPADNACISSVFTHLIQNSRGNHNAKNMFDFQRLRFEFDLLLFSKLFQAILNWTYRTYKYIGRDNRGRCRNVATIFLNSLTLHVTLLIYPYMAWTLSKCVKFGKSNTCMMRETNRYVMSFLFDTVALDQI